MIHLFKFSRYTDFEVDPEKLTFSKEDFERLEEMRKTSPDMFVENILANMAKNEFNPYKDDSNNTIILRLHQLKKDSDAIFRKLGEAEIHSQEQIKGLALQLDEINLQRQLLTNTYASRFDRRFVRLSLISNPEPLSNFLGWYADEWVDDFDGAMTPEEWIRMDYIRFVIETMVANGSFPPYGYCASKEYTNTEIDLFTWSHELRFQPETKKLILLKMKELAKNGSATDVYNIILSAWLCDFIVKRPDIKVLECVFPSHKLDKSNYLRLFKEDDTIKRESKYSKEKIQQLDQFIKLAPIIEQLKKATTK